MAEILDADVHTLHARAEELLLRWGRFTVHLLLDLFSQKDVDPGIVSVNIKGEMCMCVPG